MEGDLHGFGLAITGFNREGLYHLLAGDQLLEQVAIAGVEVVDPIGAVAGVAAVETEGAVAALGTVVGQQVGAGGVAGSIVGVGILNHQGAALAAVDAFNDVAGGGAIDAGEVVLSCDHHIHLVGGALAIFDQVNIGGYLAVVEPLAGHIGPGAEALGVGGAEAEGTQGAGAVGLGVEVGPAFPIQVVEAQVAAAAIAPAFAHLQGEFGRAHGRWGFRGARGVLRRCHGGFGFCRHRRNGLLDQLRGGLGLKGLSGVE